MNHPAEVTKEKIAAAALLAAQPLDKAFVEQAIARAIKKIDQKLERFAVKFPAPSSDGLRYEALDNIEWTSSFWTGQLWLAYELTGDDKYRQAAERQIATYAERIEKRINTSHHDLGFLYTLSCVSAWRQTGNETARQAALGAADLLLDRYHPAAGIIQAWGDLSDPEQQGRMIIDCNLNLPLLYWASEQTGNPKYHDAAATHVRQAARYIVRPDSSTYHTFFMDAVSGAPRHGTTHQGHSDDSCWARGQAWGIYGFPLSYKYLHDASLLELTKKLANYFLNRLPQDQVCCWDLIFTDDATQKDSSAAAIAVCGLIEMTENLPLLDEERSQYVSAIMGIVRSLADYYQADPEEACEGILKHGVYHMPKQIGVDECCIWGDYFYLEALLRLVKPWQSYW